MSKIKTPYVPRPKPKYHHCMRCWKPENGHHYIILHKRGYNEYVCWKCKGVFIKRDDQ